MLGEMIDTARTNEWAMTELTLNAALERHAMRDGHVIPEVEDQIDEFQTLLLLHTA